MEVRRPVRAALGERFYMVDLFIGGSADPAPSAVVDLLGGPWHLYAPQPLEKNISPKVMFRLKMCL